MEITVDLLEIRQALEKQRLDIKRELAKHVKTNGNSVVSDSDVSALAQRYVAQQQHSHAQIRLERKFAQITAALQRLAQGNFGICLSCRRRIQPARLQAIHYTEVCVQCQEEREKKGFTT